MAFKRLLTNLFILFSCILCITGCRETKDVGKPEAVVAQHLQALRTGNVAAAAKLVYQPEDTVNPNAFQQRVMAVLESDKQDFDARGGITEVSINDVLTRFSDGNVKDGQPEFIKRNEASKGTTAIVKAMVTFQNGSFKEAVYPLKHTGDAYRIVLYEVSGR